MRDDPDPSLAELSIEPTSCLWHGILKVHASTILGNLTATASLRRGWFSDRLARPRADPALY